MSDTPVSAAARPRSRSRAQRLARQQKRAADDVRLLNLLASGVRTGELALQEGLSPRRMRDRIAAALARREVEPAASFAPLQVARLSDAMMVAYAAMMGGDLKALDRVLRIGRELERYQGHHSPEPPALPPARSSPSRLPAPAPQRALPAPDDGQATQICKASP